MTSRLQKVCNINGTNSEVTVVPPPFKWDTY